MDDMKVQVKSQVCIADIALPISTGSAKKSKFWHFSIIRQHYFRLSNSKLHLLLPLIYLIRNGICREDFKMHNVLPVSPASQHIFLRSKVGRSFCLSLVPFSFHIAYNPFVLFFFWMWSFFLIIGQFFCIWSENRT